MPVIRLKDAGSELSAKHSRESGSNDGHEDLRFSDSRPWATDPEQPATRGAAASVHGLRGTEGLMWNLDFILWSR